MHVETEPSIERLLKETASAHDDYETTALGGLHDNDWSDWYATYLIEHGLSDLIPRARELNAPRLSAILKQLDIDYRRDRPRGEWPAYYAGRLETMDV